MNGELSEMRAALARFARALNQESAVLERLPALAFSQLYNRICGEGIESARAEATLEAQRSRFRRTWLRLLNRHSDTRSFVREFDAHLAPVTACAFSPDGTKLVSASEEKTLRFWEVESGRALGIVRYWTSVATCAFSPNGERVLSGYDDGRLALWNVETERAVLLLSDHHEAVTAAAFDASGQRVLSGHADGTLKLWAVEVGVAEGEAPAQNDRFYSAGQFSGAEQRAAVASLNGHQSRVTACAFSPDGRRLLSGDDRGNVRLWTADSGAPLAAFSTGDDSQVSVRVCQFSPDGSTALSIEDNHRVTLWDVATGEQLRILEEHRILRSCALSPDGKSVALGGLDGIVQVWDTETGRRLNSMPGHRHWISACSFSPDGQQVVSGSEDGTLKLWKVRRDDTDEGPWLPAHAAPVDRCAFDATGERAASADTDGTVALWDTDRREKIRDLTVAPDAFTFGAFTALAFHPRGRWLVTSRGKAIHVWDLESESSVAAAVEMESEVKCCAFSRDGSLIAVARENGLGIWSFGRWEEQHNASLLPDEGPVCWCAFGPGAEVLVSVGRGGLLRLWDIATRSILWLTNIDDRSCYAISRDGSRLLSGAHKGESYGFARIFDLEKQIEGESFRVAMSTIMACDISPDGLLILTASWEDVLRVSRSRNGAPVAISIDLTPGLRSCSLSPDGRLVMVGNRMGNVLFLRLEGEVRDGDVPDAKVRGDKAPLPALQEDALALSLPDDLLSQLPLDLLILHRVVPLSHSGSTIVLAMADVNDMRARDDVMFLTGEKVAAVSWPEAEITRVLEALRLRSS